MKYSIYLCLVLFLLSCGDSSQKIPLVKAPDSNLDQGVSAKEIADALGIHRVVLQIPMGGQGDSYGLAIRHKEGYLLSGFSKLMPGEKVKILYWLENKFIKYSLQFSNGSVIGFIEIDNPVEFTLKSVPSSKVIYNIGEVFEKWSVIQKMSSGINGTEVLEGGEIGLCLIKYDEKIVNVRLNVVPTKVESKF